MASKRLKTSANVLYDGIQCIHRPPQRLFARSIATETPNATLTQTYQDIHLDSAPTEPILKDQLTTPPPTPSRIPTTSTPARFQPQQNPFITTATLTTHAFPSLEPTAFATYPSTHLLLPLRRDLLHRAIIYEADMTRQGTASTKYRSDIHGSNRKIRPQKGSGKARLGDKKSPMLKGGGVAFGPHPRNFATGLQGKVYDVAWRTALSYRYKQNQLIVLDDVAEIEGVHADSVSRYVRDMLRYNNMGHAHGRTLFVTLQRREALFTALEGERMGREARALECVEVDVKDLLKLGRVVVERQALEWMLVEHERDLGPGERLRAWDRMMMEVGKRERMGRQHGVAVAV